MAEDWADRSVPRAIAAEMRKNWLRQQALREGERRVRAGRGHPPAPLTADDVPIVVEPGPAYALHGATPDDVRAILRLLPPGSFDGLREVRMGFDRSPVERATVRCPFTGLPARELLPGIFAGRIGGLYDRRVATIWLFAVASAAAPPPPLRAILQMEALRTLVHEAAHHFDHTFRKRRSRWATGERDKHEAWAERVEDEQAHALIAPYMREHHAARCAALEQWVAELAGARTNPLVELCGPPPVPLFGLVGATHRGEPVVAARIAYARGLHRAGLNDEATAVNDAVLAAHPDEPDALAVRACVVMCGDRDHEGAERLVQRALAIAPGCMEALEVRVRSLATQERWADVARACADAIAHTPPGTKPRRYLVETLAEAEDELRKAAPR